MADTRLGGLVEARAMIAASLTGQLCMSKPDLSQMASPIAKMATIKKDA
jgi:hypothetical protein